MSQKICVQFEVREALIMKDTLRELGHDFTENKTDILTIQASYMPITVNCVAGEISHDSASQSVVNKIKQQYMVNFYRDKAIKEGMQIQEEVKANGEVIINMIRP
jgi:hypothetical protein